jgi:hypothetical protein
MPYTEDDLKFLRKIGQIVDEPAPVKVAKEQPKARNRLWPYSYQMEWS